jgi:predicted TIM-barrel fold metal-dependent hydrolase
VYNDFLFEEFCAVDESRLVGVAILPLHDVAASVAELERAHAHGARGVSFPHDPVSLGLPSLYSGAWDPLFAVAQTAEMPVFVHIGTGGGPASANVDGPAPSVGTLLTLAGVDAMTAATDFVFSHVLTRHPRLEVALLEGGVAWLPYLSDRMAFFLRRDGVWPDDAELPSPMRLLERHVVASFIEDPTGLDLLPAIGASRVLWQSDFPHADSFWPGSRTHLARALADVPDGVARTIAETNARDLLGLHRP